MSFFSGREADSYDLDISDQCCLRDGQPCSACNKVIGLNCSTEEPTFGLALKYIALLREVNEQHDLIQRLPLEIGCFIFELCLPEEDTDEGMLKYYRPTSRMVTIPHDVPEVLSKVCYQWRQIAFSTSRLWTTLPIYLKKSNNERQLEILQQWALRSGTLPLFIGMWTDEEWYPAEKRHTLARSLAWKHTFDFVNSLASRWRTLQLFIPNFTLPWIVGNGQFPTLFQRLNILGFSFSKDVRGEGAKIRASKAFLLTGEKPRPSRVSISNALYKNIHVDWRNIAVLELASFSAQDCIFVLQDLKHLHTLSLDHMSVEFDENDWNVTQVVHKGLRVLDVFSVTTSDGFSLLHCMTLPHVAEFKFMSCISVSFGDLASLLSRSCCPLKKFTLVDMPPVYNQNEIVNLFSLPSFKHLTDFHMKLGLLYMMDIIDCLDACDIGGTVLLPELSNLSIEIIYRTHLPSVKDCTEFWQKIHSLLKPISGGGLECVWPLQNVKISVFYLVYTGQDLRDPHHSPLDKSDPLIVAFNQWNREYLDGRGFGGSVSIVDSKGVYLI